MDTQQLKQQLEQLMEIANDESQLAVFRALSLSLACDIQAKLCNKSGTHEFTDVPEEIMASKAFYSLTRMAGTPSVGLEMFSQTIGKYLFPSLAEKAMETE